MSFCRSSLRRFLPWALMGLSSLVARELLAGEGRKIEISDDPRGQELATNLNHFLLRRDNLKDLNSDLSRGMQWFSPNRSSVDPVIVPPMRPPGRAVIQSKKVKEMLEREKNWVFMNPEDMTAAPTAEEIFGLKEYDKDGQEKKKLSPVEEFYKNLEKQKERNQPAKRGQLKDDVSLKQPGEFGMADDSGLPSSLMGSEKKLRDIFDPDTAKPGDSGGSSVFSDIFGLEKSATPERSPLEVQRLHKSWDELYGSPAPPVSSGGLTPFSDFSRDTRPASAMDGWPALTPPQPAVPAWNTVSPAPAIVPDWMSKSANPWNSTPAPKYELPKPTPATFWDFPRRQM